MTSPHRLRPWLAAALFTGALGLTSPGPAAADTDVGGKLGLATAKLAVPDDTTTGGERDFRNSLTAGAFVHLRFSRSLGLQLELAGTNRGSDLIFQGAPIGHYSLDYLDLAVLGRLEARMRLLSIYMLAGPTAHVLLRARFKNISGDTPVVNDILDSSTRYDLGLAAGPGITIGPFSWGAVLLEARYVHGFIDVDKANDDVVFKNRTITVTAGYQYSF